MAKTGSISIAQGEQSVANNTTLVNITGKITTTGESWRGDSRTGTVTVTQDGKTIHSGSFTHGAPANSTTTLFTIKNLKVSHYSDGSSGTIGVSYNYDSGWCKASTSKVLTKIPRQATISTAPDFNDEENPTITYKNPAGSKVTSLQACISLTGAKADIPYRDIPLSGTSYTFTLKEEERETLLLATTGSNSRTVKFYVKTVISGVTYYSSLSKTFTVINGKPTFETYIQDDDEKIIELTGDESVLVRYCSDADINVQATAYKGATISGIKVICGNQIIISESGKMTDIGSGNFVVSVTDSRNNTVTQTIVVPFIEYVNLTCDVNANAPDADGDMRFSISGNCFSGSFGVSDNAVKVYYRYKANNDEYGEWIEAPDVVLNSDNTYVAEISLNGLDYRNRYTFQAKSEDLLMEVASVERPVKTIPVFDWGENDFNFNVPVTMQGVELDYIVEQGTDDMWTYRKWASGLAECWGLYSLKVDCTKTWGNLYETESLTLPDFPFAFAEVPFVQLSWHSSYAGSIERVNQVSTTNSGETFFTRAVSASKIPGSIGIHATGRWKE